MPTRRLLLKLPLLPLLSSGGVVAAEVSDGSWAHAARQRTLPWRLRLPAGDAPCPLVVYSHGLGGSREGGHAWGSAWANAGIAVLHVQHPGSDIETLRGGARALKAAASADQMVERLQDLYFVIDELLRRSAAGEAPWTRVRADALGVAGHSFGAQTAQAMAGQRYSGVADLSDPRLKAFVALSPSLPVGVKLSATEAFAGITRPFFALTGSLDASPIQTAGARAQRAAVFDALPRGQRALLWLDGANHQAFGGGRSGRAESEEDRYAPLIARATAAWWRWRLLGDEAARLELLSLQGLTAADQLLVD